MHREIRRGFDNINKFNEYFKNANEYIRNIYGMKIYGFITKNKNNNFIRFYSVNSMTEKFIPDLPGTNFSDEIQTFIDELYLDKNKYQAIIVDIFGLDIKGTKYKSQRELRTALKVDEF
uniref:Uncharacterized protein n=1 Tax=Panagrolaimus sp. PS1159 TaxID=55785 RepID=A0AC35GF13_9BILA